LTGFWLVSYIILWLAVVALALAFVATLRELGVAGVLRREVGNNFPHAMPTLEEDGPSLHSPLPAGALPHLDRGRVMVVFLTPLCEGCQDVVPALNELAAGSHDVHIMTVLRATARQAAAFLKVFPLSVSIVPDEDGALFARFELQSAPFGLLYENGRLARKGRVENGLDDLLALLGSPSASASGRSRVYPADEAVVGAGS